MTSVKEVGVSLKIIDFISLSADDEEDVNESYGQPRTETYLFN